MSLDFNTLLAQAAELKEAQLRETRREYQAAPECLRYTLVRGAGPNAATTHLRTSVSKRPCLTRGALCGIFFVSGASWAGIQQGRSRRRSASGPCSGSAACS
jgi:hypothetical protein